MLSKFPYNSMFHNFPAFIQTQWTVGLRFDFSSFYWWPSICILSWEPKFLSFVSNCFWASPHGWPPRPGTEYASLKALDSTHLPHFASYLDVLPLLFLQYLSQSLDPLFLPSDFLFCVPFLFIITALTLRQAGLLGQHPHWFSPLP